MSGVLSKSVGFDVIHYNGCGYEVHKDSEGYALAVDRQSGRFRYIVWQKGDGQSVIPREARGAILLAGLQVR
jgi:hypothetical protein